MSQALHPALQLLNRTSLVTQIIIGLLAGIALAVIALQVALSVGFIGNVFASALKAVALVNWMWMIRPRSSARCPVLAATGGTLDALFNNAGFGQPGAVEDICAGVARPV